MKTIRVGSRESKLAIAQAEIVMRAIREGTPGARLELVTMKTTGDLILDRTVDEIGGKGLFVKELDRALADKRLDLCVHSFKDMPTEEDPDLPIVAVSVREDPRDVLLLPKGQGEVRRSLPVGCSSQRRRLQLERLYPGWEIRPVRGNVLTRLEKMDRGEYGGLVLAAAGIKRLGLWERVHRVFSVEEMLPCPCQGILAVQARKGEDIRYLSGFHNLDAWDVSRGERAFLRELGGGCSSPAAAFGEVDGGMLHLRGLHVTRYGELLRGEIRGPRAQGERLGEQLAWQLLESCGQGG